MSQELASSAEIRLSQWLQCFLDHDHPKDQSGGLQGPWVWPEAPERSYSSVWTDDAVTCNDEMDATIWQLVFNLLCNRREHS